MNVFKHSIYHASERDISEYAILGRASQHLAPNDLADKKRDPNTKLRFLVRPIPVRRLGDIKERFWKNIDQRKSL